MASSTAVASEPKANVGVRRVESRCKSTYLLADINNKLRGEFMLRGGIFDVHLSARAGVGGGVSCPAKMGGNAEARYLNNKPLPGMPPLTSIGFHAHGLSRFTSLQRWTVGKPLLKDPASK